MDARQRTIFWVAAFLCASALSACSGNASMLSPARNGPAQAPGGSDAQPQISELTSSPTPTPVPPNVWTGPGNISGHDDQFLPVDGDTATGGNGQDVDGIACAPTMSNVYHVHVFVGVYVNGVHYALPDTIGMDHPQPEPTNHFTVYAKCYYDLHTHDASGIAHVESADPGGVPQTGTIFTTQNLFDVWGIVVNGGQVGNLLGPVHVVTSGQVYRGGNGNGVIYRSTYVPWLGDPNAIPLYSHEVIFLEVGQVVPDPSKLPNILFYTEF